jgi:glycosyltransferase involved in cell wall biosynthesis
MNNKQVFDYKRQIRILFFPDKISGQDSGARSARSTLKSLLELGYIVGVFCSDANNISKNLSEERVTYYHILSKMQANSHFFEPKLLNQFKDILAEFKPDYFFMAGSIQKPAMLARAARKFGIRTIFLFYITDYYCAKTYAGLRTGPCLKCIENSSLEALKNNCVKGNPKLISFFKGAIVRFNLQNEIRKSYKVIGYGDNQIDIYKKLGIEQEKCAKISFQFDTSELDNFQTSDGDYFLILGQPTIEKGWHTLNEILSRCKSSPKIKMIFHNKETEKEAIEKYNLRSFIESGVITTVREVYNRYDILQIIASARAVLIPSYYPTTGEFVLLESLIFGKPILVFDVGVHKNIIIHRSNGMLAKVGDFESFSRNIDDVNTSTDLRLTLSDGARSAAMTLFLDESRLHSLNKIFQ